MTALLLLLLLLAHLEVIYECLQLLSALDAASLRHQVLVHLAAAAPAPRTATATPLALSAACSWTSAVHYTCWVRGPSVLYCFRKGCIKVLGEVCIAMINTLATLGG
jgi:hypothetical protein